MEAPPGPDILGHGSSPSLQLCLQNFDSEVYSSEVVTLRCVGHARSPWSHA